MRTTPPTTRARVCLVIGGILLGIAVGEIAARAVGFRYRPHMQNRVYFTQPDSLRGWKNRADVSGPYGQDEFLTWVSMNALGQRGVEKEIARDPSRVRVAILGDSQTWGDGVADEETFVHLLDSRTVDALNFGVMGYGTDQALLTYETEVTSFAPDVVVITVFLGNDLRDNLSEGSTQFPKPRFRLDDEGELCLDGAPVEHSQLLRSAVDVYRIAMRHSHLLNALAEIGTPESPDPRPGRTGWHDQDRPMRPEFLTSGPSADGEPLELATRLLLELAARIAEAGAQPVVLLLPDVWQVEAALDPAWQNELRASSIDWRRPQSFIRDRLESASVPVLSALQPLAEAASGGAIVFYPRWRHLTALGHRVVAEQLGTWLRNSERPSTKAPRPAVEREFPRCRGSQSAG